MTEKDPRQRVIDHLAELVDGTAPEEIRDLVAESDELRDLRHDAQKAAALVVDAAGDHVHRTDLESAVAQALEEKDGAQTAADPGPSEPAESSEPARVAAEVTATDASSSEPAKGPDPQARSRREDRKLWIVGTGAVFAVAASIALFWGRGDQRGNVASGDPWQGQVAHVAHAGGLGALSVCDADGTSCKTAKAGDAFPKGATLKTDKHVRAHLRMNDGTEVSVDRSTRLALDADSGRKARLLSGAIVADVRRREGSHAQIALPLGQIKVLGTKFALRTDERAASVDVSRGSVELADDEERTVTVRAGEEGRLVEGQPPSAATSLALAEAMAWSDGARAELEADEVGRGLGELRAQKPGEKQERSHAVQLVSHRVKVRIVGAMARTEIEEVFNNTTDEVLEGIFRFPLPADANIERLALEVDGKLEEGAFVDRDRAAAIWRGSIVQAAPELRRDMKDEIIWVPGPWRDPALLEWQRGNRFELRIYPIPRRGSRRIVLAYTQLVKPTAGVRRYIYPLAHDPEESTRVDDFSVDLEVRGHDREAGLRSAGYEMVDSTPTPELQRLSFAERKFVPRGDLVVEYALASRDRELVAWAHQPSPSDERAAKVGSGDADRDYPYVAIALRPKLPRAAAEEQRAYALVVDTSRSMYGESLRRAAAVAARIVRELPAEDRVTALACDSECRSLPGGEKAPGPELAGHVEAWINSQTAEGASDLTGAVTEAMKALDRSAARALRVVYVGDGTPTVGPVRPGTVAQAVRRAVGTKNVSITAVAVGADSDTESLRAVARGGGGVVVPYVPGSSVASAAFAALAATYGHALRDVRVELPAGFADVAPERLDTLAAGDETLIVARMTRPEVKGDVLVKGQVGSEPFEQRYPLEVRAVRGVANAFVPRLYAATRIVDLERKSDASSKAEAVALSSRFDVASRYTSLLVLESAAMFKAFGLDNRRDAPDWTGEQEAEEATAEGALEMEDQGNAPGPLSLGGGDGSIRPGAAGQGLASGHARMKASASPAPAKKPMSSSSPYSCAPGDPLCQPREGDTLEREESPAPRDVLVPEPTRPLPRRTWIPMRRVWDRKGSVTTSRTIPKQASVGAIADAERELETHPERRSATKKLYTLYAVSGQFTRAEELAERWSSKDPLDPEALTARADLAARRGERELAIRMLGSVVDVRPGDVAAQQRLGRLYRWQDRPEIGCRFSVALAELRSGDAKALAEALDCSREIGESWLSERLLGAAEEKARTAAERILDGKENKLQPEERLSGDLRIEAEWDGDDVDVDLSFLDPDGYRVSWLGAPTRSVITATDVTSNRREGLALRGAKPGEYVIEVVRGAGSGRVSGRLTVKVAGTRQEIAFDLDEERRAVGVATVWMQSRLEPLR